MILLNSLEKEKEISLETYKTFITLLSPFAPHLCEEIWREYSQEDTSITEVLWPIYQESLLISSKATYAIQVSGKLRGSIEVSTDLSQDEIETLARNENNVAKWLEGSDIKKVIFVKNKLINFVI
jgi:leucyl-tRNA synthetase